MPNTNPRLRTKAIRLLAMPRIITGAAFNALLLLGDWKRPKPRLSSALLQITLCQLQSAAMKEKRKYPVAVMSSPVLANSRVLILFER